MDYNDHNDKELFPNLDPNRISTYADRYRTAVHDNLSRLTALARETILHYGREGAATSSVFIDKWYPPERHRSTELSEAEKQFNFAIRDGSIDGFPAIEDLWISHGDVLHRYLVSGNKHKAQIHYGNGRFGPEIQDYLTSVDDVLKTDGSKTDFSYDFFRSEVLKGFSAFQTGLNYLKAKKKLENLKKTPGCSPKMLIIFILLTALGVYWQYFGDPDFLSKYLGFLPGLLMLVFGALSIIGIFMLLSPSKNNASMKIGDTVYVISPVEEEKIKRAMADEYEETYRIYRYLVLWKKHLEEFPNAYPEIFNCDGKNMILDKLRDLDSRISWMETLFDIYRAFPSTEGVNPELLRL